jgi:hypothetical protein
MHAVLVRCICKSNSSSNCCTAGRTAGAACLQLAISQTESKHHKHMLTDGQQLAEPLGSLILLLGVLAVQALHLGGQLVQLLRSEQAGTSTQVR